MNPKVPTFLMKMPKSGDDYEIRPDGWRKAKPMAAKNGNEQRAEGTPQNVPQPACPYCKAHPVPILICTHKFDMKVVNVNTMIFFCGACNAVLPVATVGTEAIQPLIHTGAGMRLPH